MQHTHIPLALRSALKQPSRPSSPVLGNPSSPPPYAAPSTRPQTASSALTFPSISTYQGPQFATGTPLLSPNPSAPVVSQGYTPKVSFDTFENPAASMFSYTLHVQSEGYAQSRSTRVFLCAASPDGTGSEALEWALECLVQDGDQLIVFRGIDQEELEKDHELVREEAKALLRYIQARSVEYDPDRKVSIILECIAGRVTTTLDRLIALYRPDSVVVGMRGHHRRGVLSFGGGRPGGMFSGFGSVSKYALSRSPVPIIVVRPESNVKKVREKRLRDPKRGTHFDELPRVETDKIGTLPVTPSISPSISRA